MRRKKLCADNAVHENARRLLILPLLFRLSPQPTSRNFGRELSSVLSCRAALLHRQPAHHCRSQASTISGPHHDACGMQYVWLAMNAVSCLAFRLTSEAGPGVRGRHRQPHAADSGEERKGGGRGQGRSGEAVAQLPLRASSALARICPDPFRPALIALCCGACSAVLSLDRCSSVRGRNGSLIWREVLLA